MAKDVNAEMRVNNAMVLRSQGLSYDEIARRLGYASRSAVYTAVNKELEEYTAHNVDELRRLENVSLDKLEYVCWQRLEDARFSKGMLFAVDRILAIKERRAKMNGIDMSREAYMGPQIIIEEAPNGYFGIRAEDVIHAIDQPGQIDEG